MINTLKVPTIPKFRLGRVLGFSAALLLTSVTASFAAPKLNTVDALIEIQLKQLSPSSSLLNKTSAIDPTLIAQATVNAINALSATSRTTPSSLVAAALKRVPQFAPVISKAALAKVYGTSTATLTTPAKKNSDATKIVSTSYSKALATYKPGKLPHANTFTGYTDKSDIAAAITIEQVSAVPLTTNTDPKSPTPLQVVVSAAVKAGMKVKATSSTNNGVSGAVAGAIYKTAGADNVALTSTTGADGIVQAILTTAARSAQARALEIAQAAGYAFATTYRETHNDATAEVGATEFANLNVTAIVNAIKAGLSPGNFNKFEIKGFKGLKLTGQVTAGITLAYNDANPSLRDNGSGRGGVTFANGVATAVTPVN